MEYQIFARKFRPQQFDEVVGQEHIVTTLQNALGQNRIAQSFLFVGSRALILVQRRPPYSKQRGN